MSIGLFFLTFALGIVTPWGGVETSILGGLRCDFVLMGVEMNIFNKQLLFFSILD
jgi:hypothetical protein